MAQIFKVPIESNQRFKSVYMTSPGLLYFMVFKV